MAKFFRIPATWTEYGVYYVKADNLEQAKDIVNDASLPKNGEYLDCSFEIDPDGIKTFDTEEDLRGDDWFDEDDRIIGGE